MIRLALKSDSSSLAKLHAETLITSFLASLGQVFLHNLYTFLIQKEKVWVYEEEGVIKGFVSFSHHSSGMMKRFLKSPRKSADRQINQGFLVRATNIYKHEL